MSIEVSESCSTMIMIVLSIYLMQTFSPCYLLEFSVDKMLSAIKCHYFMIFLNFFFKFFNEHTD